MIELVLQPTQNRHVWKRSHRHARPVRRIDWHLLPAPLVLALLAPVNNCRTPRSEVAELDESGTPANSAPLSVRTHLRGPHVSARNLPRAVWGLRLLPHPVRRPHRPRRVVHEHDDINRTSEGPRLEGTGDACMYHTIAIDLAICTVCCRITPPLVRPSHHDEIECVATGSSLPSRREFCSFLLRGVIL